MNRIEKEEQINPQQDVLIKSMNVCVKNGQRLMQNAEMLSYDDSTPTGYAIYILAQEEFAKAFLLYLVAQKVVHWETEVRRALKDHSCKQLLGVVLDFLSPNTEQWLERLSLANIGKAVVLPGEVADAINLFRHEKIRRWQSSTWVWQDDPEYNRTVKRIAEGALDEEKQDALYVRIGRDGRVASHPTRVTKNDLEEAQDKADRFNAFVSRIGQGDAVHDKEFEHVMAILKCLFSETNAVATSTDK